MRMYKYDLQLLAAYKKSVHETCHILPIYQIHFNFKEN